MPVACQQGAAQLGPAHAGQADVRHHQVEGPLIAVVGQRLLGAGAADDAAPWRFHEHGNGFAQFGVVFDVQDAQGGVPQKMD